MFNVGEYVVFLGIEIGYRSVPFSQGLQVATQSF